MGASKAKCESRRLGEVEKTQEFNPEMVSVHDSSGRVVAINSFLANKMNMAGELLLGKKCHEVFQGKDTPCDSCPMQARIVTSNHSEMQVKALGGKYTVNIYPLLGENEEILSYVHVIRESKGTKAAISQPKGEELISSFLRIASSINSSMDHGEILRGVTALIAQQLGYSFCVAMYYENKQAEFGPAAQSGLEPEVAAMLERIRVAEGESDSIDDVLQKKCCQEFDLVRDAMKLPPNFRDVFPGRKILAIPVVMRDAVTCLLIVGSDELKESDPQKTEVLEGVASLLSTALENIRLYEDSMGQSVDLAKKIETITVMHDIDRHILSSLSKEEIIDAVTANVQRVIPYDTLSITQMDRDRAGFHVVAAAGEQLDGIIRGSYIPAAGSLLDLVVRSRRPLISADANMEKRLRQVATTFIRGGMR